MRRHRWPCLAAALALMALLFPGPDAGAQSTPDPRPVPKPFIPPEALPGAGHPVCTVDNFSGFVAVAESRGKGADSAGNTYEWEADLRFMQGIYVARDGVARLGTFAFI